MTILPPEQHSSGSSASYTKKRSAAKTKEKEPVRPHVKASLEDINWLRSQPPCVQQLWLDCVAVEQFGGQQRKLESSLSDKFFKRAKMALEKQGLFSFEPIGVVSTAGRLKITGWKVENLHGYYIKNYWEISPSPKQNVEPSGQNVEPSGQNVPLIETNCHDVAPETRATTDPAENQPRLNYPSTTH